MILPSAYQRHLNLIYRFRPFHSPRHACVPSFPFFVYGDLGFLISLFSISVSEFLYLLWYSGCYISFTRACVCLLSDPEDGYWRSQKGKARRFHEWKWRPKEVEISTSGCPFGEGCHFLHYVPGGAKAVSQIVNLGSNPHFLPATRNSAMQPSFPDGSSPPAVKSRLCNKYNSAEGCKFGDKCHFAHGEWELGKPTFPSFEDPRSIRSMPGRMGNHNELPAPASFGAFSAAKISVDASLAGAVIGKNGINTKQICRVTGAKLLIRDHESDPDLKNIELEGTFDQIKQASAMVSELIANVRSASGPPIKHSTTPFSSLGSNFKTKLCENFTKGSCTFGERCHFAHGADELRKTRT